MTPLRKLHDRQEKTTSLLCVGLDSDIAQLPERFQQAEFPQFAFNQWIIDQTHEYVCAFKPNMAFYEARGDAGIRELKLTIEYVQEQYSDIFTICDAKRADIGSTNVGYVSSIFDWYGFDAVTLNPYLGSEAIRPFLDRTDKVSIILCRTSNPGAGEVQDLVVSSQWSVDSDKIERRIPLQQDNEILLPTGRDQNDIRGIPLWQVVAHKIAHEWNAQQNCMIVMGATKPAELKMARQIIGDEIDMLIPGVGAQGGDVRTTLEHGKNARGRGMVINSSRGIIFAQDPRQEAHTLWQQMQ